MAADYFRMSSRMCSLHPTFFAWLFTLLITTDSMSIQPIFDPRLTSVHGSIPMRTPSAVRMPDLVAEPILESPPVVLVPLVSRRQRHITDNKQETSDDGLSSEPEPTCAELKTMWRKARRISRQMELTNEIPKLRDPFVGGAYDFRPSKYPSANPYSKAPKSSRIRNVFQSNHMPPSNSNSHHKFEVAMGPKPSSKSFGQIIRDQDEHLRYKDKVSSGLSSGFRPTRLGFDDFDSNDYSKNIGLKSRERIPGQFSDYPYPEEALGVYGTVVNTPEERAKFRSQSRGPPEPGTRIRPSNWNRALSRGRVPFRATKPHAQYHYGSLITHYPGDRYGGVGSAGNGGGGSGNIGGNSMYIRPSSAGLAEFPPEVNQRSDNDAARVERFDKVEALKLKDSCRLLSNKPCKNDVDCFCIGSTKFFCGGNRCRPRFKPSKYNKSPIRERHLYYIENPYDQLNIVEPYNLKSDPIWPAPF